jgi:alkylation response protein AidB-like acyl-CoA dehydrogenase
MFSITKFIKKTTPILTPTLRHFSRVVLTGNDIISPTIGLNEDQQEFYQLAKQFADKEMAPNAAKWDEEAIFPIETFKKFGELGFGGIYVKEDVGGSALTR